MKITESQLRNIVRQELITVLSEDQQQLDEGWGQKLAALGAGLGLAAGMAKGIPHDYTNKSSSTDSSQMVSQEQDLASIIDTKTKDNSLLSKVGKDDKHEANKRISIGLTALYDTYMRGGMSKQQALEKVNKADAEQIKAGLDTEFGKKLQNR